MTLFATTLTYEMNLPDFPLKSKIMNTSSGVEFHRRLFNSRQETDNWSLFLHGSFVLEYADSSNQRDFFLYGLLVLRICPIKSVEYA